MVSCGKPSCAGAGPHYGTRAHGQCRGVLDLGARWLTDHGAEPLVTACILCPEEGLELELAMRLRYSTAGQVQRLGLQH